MIQAEESRMKFDDVNSDLCLQAMASLEDDEGFILLGEEEWFECGSDVGASESTPNLWIQSRQTRPNDTASLLSSSLADTDVLLGGSSASFNQEIYETIFDDASPEFVLVPANVYDHGLCDSSGEAIDASEFHDSRMDPEENTDKGSYVAGVYSFFKRGLYKAATYGIGVANVAREQAQRQALRLSASNLGSGGYDWKITSTGVSSSQHLALPGQVISLDGSLQSLDGVSTTSKMNLSSSRLVLDNCGEVSRPQVFSQGPASSQSTIAVSAYDLLNSSSNASSVKGGYELAFNRTSTKSMLLHMASTSGAYMIQSGLGTANSAVSIGARVFKSAGRKAARFERKHGMLSAAANYAMTGVGWIVNPIFPGLVDDMVHQNENEAAIELTS